jgi:AAA family ATP:ADP antiporter
MLSLKATTERNHHLSQTLFSSISVGLLTVALGLAKTGRDALFFQGQGLLQLPMAYMGIGMASLPAAILLVKAMKTWGARPSRVAILIFAAVALAGFVPFLKEGSYPILISIFIFIPTIFGLLFASIWLLASDLFENAPKMIATRSFSQIAASALAGGMAGGFISKGLAPHLDPEWLVLLAALVISIVAGVVIKTQQKFPPNVVPTKSQKEGERIAVLRAFSKKYSRMLLLISMTGALAGLFIEFQFYSAASSAGNDLRANTNFFANFYTMLYLSSLILELLAAPKIQDKVGLRGGLVILPFALLGVSTFVIAAATALSRSVLKVTEGGLKASIHRSIWEQAFIPLQSGERSIVKMIVDGIGPLIAQGIGATLLFLWLMRVDVADPSSLNTGWMAWVVLLTIPIWLLLTRNLHLEFTQVQSVREGAVDCARFPDQCPTTTELGKGIA